MLKFEDFSKTLDGDVMVVIYTPLGELVHKGKLKDLKYIPDNIMRIIPHCDNRQVYLEIRVY